MDAFVIMAGSFLMLIAVIGTVAGILRYSTFYQRALAGPESREVTLDGLRGVAALLVVVHHAILSCNSLTTGNWGGARINLLGPTGVMIFFLLTGYLFWGKARAANGKMNAWKLWRGRLYRIAPLYLFSVLFLLLFAAVQTGGQWLALKNWQPSLRLLALGALPWQSFGSVSLGDYNARVVWTLSYEWGFYLILPFIAWLAVGRRTFYAAVGFYLIIFTGIWFNLDFHYASFFILGMLCQVLLANQTLRSELRGSFAAVLALSLALLLGWMAHSRLFAHMSYSSVEGGLLPVFFVAAAGNSFFCFLTHPTVRCLGAISFSMYLLHGIMLRLVYGLLKSTGMIHLPQVDYWLINAVMAIAITLICAITYALIEFPFLSRSHKKAGENHSFRPQPCSSSSSEILKN